VLDLYQRWVVGERLGPDEFVVSADEDLDPGPLRGHHRHRAVGRPVEQVMASEPYASAARVFRVVDNGSSHRGQASIDRREGTGARS
jgi:hypothetical protein